MASAAAAIDIPATPNTVWQLIGGFGSLPDWLPYIPSSELGEGAALGDWATRTATSSLSAWSRSTMPPAVTPTRSWKHRSR
jgi:hypothetical protein